MATDNTPEATNAVPSIEMPKELDAEQCQQALCELRSQIVTNAHLMERISSVYYVLCQLNEHHDKLHLLVPAPTQVQLALSELYARGYLSDEALFHDAANEYVQSLRNLKVLVDGANQMCDRLAELHQLEMVAAELHLADTPAS